MKRAVGRASPILLASLIALATAGLVEGGTRDSAVQPPPGLTHQGRLLWNFEGLLRANFPNSTEVSALVTSRGSLNFSCSGYCTPNAVFAHYEYTFLSSRATNFHLSTKTFKGTFGNYPRQVLIRGRSIACDKGEQKFLVEFRDSTGFTLGCVKPPPD